MSIKTDDGCYVIERKDATWLVKPSKFGKQRLINLRNVKYIEFLDPKHPYAESNAFTAQIFYESGNPLTLGGSDAKALYNYCLFPNSDLVENWEKNFQRNLLPDRERGY